MSVPECPPTLAVGGKARVLFELQASGFPVPEFVCSPVDLDGTLQQLGAPLAVRSSASLEDGRALSFAGQFQSFLNIQTPDELAEAVRQCRTSADTPAVREYCRNHGVDPGSIHMNVIVQRMIRPELAGVAFTVNPATGAEEVVIEACEGLADQLLLGRQPALSPNHHLVKKYAPQITTLARRIQRHFGAPQDIEFAVEQGIVYVVQARPITKIDFAPELGVWTNADFRDGGVSSSVCTPLMWSFYDFIWESTLKGFLREIKLLDGDFAAGRMFFGRPYWNLGAVKQCLAKLPGFNECKFDEDLSVQPQYVGDGLCTPVTLVGLLRALPTAFAVQSIWKQQERFDRQFMAGGFEALTHSYQTVGPDPAAALDQLIHGPYQVTESNYFRTIYCASLAKLDFTDAFPEADYATLVGGLPGLQHFEPIHALAQMRRAGVFDQAAFLERFRHHSRRELDIRAPRWDEDPEWVRNLFEHCQPAPEFPARPAYEQARAKAMGQFPWRRRRAFARKLDRLRTFLWLREEMRDLSSRVYYLLRRHVLAIAQERGLGDDVFFMTFREILGNDRSQVAGRREIYDSYRNFKSPNEIAGRFMPGAAPTPGCLRGIVASRGSVRGIARIARSVEEAAAVAAGAILVCPFTDPGWTPILGRVAGVITETGGLLSHAAIICREYGIPALLSVADATTRIPNGRQIHLRADCGAVEWLDSQAPNGSSHFGRSGEPMRQTEVSPNTTPSLNRIP